jgi:predicted nucleic-acid-binding Zn-ribbon protein
MTLDEIEAERAIIKRDGFISNIDKLCDQAALAVTDGKRFKYVSCSQCGHDFGPGDHGYSHCIDHQIRSQEFMLTVAFDAMRICLGLPSLHHGAGEIGRFILARDKATPEIVGTKSVNALSGAWTCQRCGFVGFWEGGPHDCENANRVAIAKVPA